MMRKVFREVLQPAGMWAWRIFVPALTVCSMLAEVTSFWINHQSYVLTNFDRLTHHIQIAWSDEEPQGSTLQSLRSMRSLEPNTTSACTRYTYYTVDPNCDAIEGLPKRLLCEVSLAPVEKVCAERAAADWKIPS